MIRFNALTSLADVLSKSVGKKNGNSWMYMNSDKDRLEYVGRSN